MKDVDKAKEQLIIELVELCQRIAELETLEGERERVQEALRETEERFRLAFENSNIGMCLVDTEGRLTKVNDQMYEIFGYSKEELEGMSENDITHPAYLDVSPRFIQRASSGEITHAKFEKQYFHKQGHLVWGHVSSSLVRDVKDEPLYFISHLQDITERKRAETKILRAKQEWERPFDAVPDLIMILDNEYRVVRVNKAMAERLGCTPKDLVGKICCDVFHGAGEPASNCPHARLMVDGIAHSAEVHEDRLGGDDFEVIKAFK